MDLLFLLSGAYLFCIIAVIAILYLFVRGVPEKRKREVWNHDQQTAFLHEDLSRNWQDMSPAPRHATVSRRLSFSATPTPPKTQTSTAVGTGRSTTPNLAYGLTDSGATQPVRYVNQRKTGIRLHPSPSHRWRLWSKDIPEPVGF